MKIHADEQLDDRMESFGISIGIVIGLLLIPVLIFAVFKPANVSSSIISLTVRYPKSVLLAIFTTSLVCEVAIALIPSTEVKNAFTILSRMINVSMWIFATLAFCGWLILETYDSFASESGWFNSTDILLLLTPEGRDQVFESRKLQNGKFKHLEPYVSHKKSLLHINAKTEYPRLDIRPTRWLQHAASKETRELWAPILEAFFPYAKSIKQNSLKQQSS